MNADRASAVGLFPAVSRETWDRLDIFAAQLAKWQKTINLVSPKTLGEIWTRHIADSLQLLDFVPDDARIFVDLGSGGGLPGLVVAAALAGRPDAIFHLVESDQRKAAFLREAARAMNVPVKIHNKRIEDALESWPHGADVVSARALAPLPELLSLAAPLLKAGTIGLFPKGQDIESEMTEATKYWAISATIMPSRTDDRAGILVVSSLTPR